MTESLKKLLIKKLAKQEKQKKIELKFDKKKPNEDEI
jgi:hypothetical protein